MVFTENFSVKRRGRFRLVRLFQEKKAVKKRSFHKPHTEEEEDVGPRGHKRKRPDRPFRQRKGQTIEETAEEEGEDVIFGEIVGPSAPSKPKRKRRRAGKRTRKPTIKSKLLKRLRAKKKIQKAKLRQTERDINSLVCHRKKAA
jgi:hypothetical protein